MAVEIEQAVQEAQASLDFLISHFAPMATLRQSLLAIAEDAHQKADEIVAGANKRAGDIVGSAEASANEKAAAETAANARRESLAAEIEGLVAKHAGLGSEIAAAQAHLDEIKGEIAETLKRFAAKPK